jgi:hypothetical protein
MAELLILEFSHPDGASVYQQVNKNLGLDAATGSGEWPPGLIDHHAGVDGDALVVVEAWESRGAQDDFMRNRLGPAFAEASAPQPTRVTWLSEIGAWSRD